MKDIWRNNYMPSINFAATWFTFLAICGVSKAKRHIAITLSFHLCVCMSICRTLHLLAPHVFCGTLVLCITHFSLYIIVNWLSSTTEFLCRLRSIATHRDHFVRRLSVRPSVTLAKLPYKRKFSRESNFRYFREWFENAKICLREKLYLKRKLKSLYRHDILLHTLSSLKSGRKSRNHLV